MNAFSRTPKQLNKFFKSHLANSPKLLNSFESTWFKYSPARCFRRQTVVSGSTTLWKNYCTVGGLALHRQNAIEGKRSGNGFRRRFAVAQLDGELRYFAYISCGARRQHQGWLTARIRSVVTGIQSVIDMCGGLISVQMNQILGRFGSLDIQNFSIVK